MESTEIINRIQDAVKMLPLQKLKITLDFLEDLKQSNEEETQLLLNDADFMEEYRQAKDDIQSGYLNGPAWQATASDWIALGLPAAPDNNRGDLRRRNGG